MTVKRARIVFAVLMQAAREGKHLTQYDKQQLSIARQTLRQIRKPVSNPSRLTIAEAKRIVKESGHRLVRNVEWNEFIITGPYFPTGYHSDSLTDVIDTLLYEQRRRQSIKGAKDSGRSNPNATLIYGKVNRIIATKVQKHICDAECKRHGHRYFHDFSSRAKMYGLPNGDLLITTR